MLQFEHKLIQGSPMSFVLNRTSHHMVTIIPFGFTIYELSHYMNTEWKHIEIECHAQGYTINL